MSKRYECACGRDFATTGGRATHQRTCETHARAGAEETAKIVDVPASSPAEHLAALVKKIANPYPHPVAGAPYYGWTADDAKAIDQLDNLQSLIDAATAMQHGIVADLRTPRHHWSRDARASWELIGKAIGISKQLASHRFGKSVTARTRAAQPQSDA